DAVGAWGVRWLVPHKRPSEIDPDGLMQWIRRHVVLGELPTRRTVIRFELLGRPRRYYWLILRTGEVSLCPEHPGFEEDLFVEAMEEGTVRVDGPPPLVRSLPRWFLLRASGAASVAGSSRG